MKDFDKGAKRKCSKCSTLFFDFNKFPTTCPSCNIEVSNLKTNISKRGRPPKNAKVEESKKPSEEIEINDLAEEDTTIEQIEPDDSDDDAPVEDIIEIKKEDN